MTKENQIRISEYSYNLPPERIARFPLSDRDASKLLLYRDGKIEDKVFTDLPSLLPDNAFMVFNETKVVPARLHFLRATGANVEIFCLEPVSPAEYAGNFAATARCSWKCIVGNAKRCRIGERLILANPSDDSDVCAIGLEAQILQRDGQTATVEFNWKGGVTFSEVLDLCGKIPIPPYLERDTLAIDLERYQTTYALQRGSVAAPTAGLHFTPRVIDRIAARGIDIRKICLHVGAGTFLPVKSELIAGHSMHREPFIVSREFIAALAESISRGRKTVAVGTTSVRTLESLYYAGLQCLAGQPPHDIEQWEPYDALDGTDTETALRSLLKYMEQCGMDSLNLGTRIIIVPGYKLHVTDALVTNFHQPQSTLLLLIAAFVGDEWKRIYSHAMDEGYRFLSYGDSSLLFAVK